MLGHVVKPFDAYQIAAIRSITQKREKTAVNTLIRWSWNFK